MDQLTKKRRHLCGPVVMALALALLPAIHAAKSEGVQPGFPVRTFVLRICNKTNKNVLAAIIHRARYDEDKWLLEAWYTAKPGACRDIGGIPRGYFYVYAHQEGTQLHWAGEARQTCVDPRAVERTIFPQERCLTGEQNLGFFERFTDQELTQIDFQ